MKKSVIYISIIVVCLALIGGCIYFYIPKIRVVRMGYLIENYQGTLEAKQKLDKLKQEQNGELDSLKRMFNGVYMYFQQDTTNMQVYSKLMQIQEKYHNKKDFLDNVYEEYDAKLSQGVINQLNENIEQICNDRGIDILLSTYNGEGVLYAMPEWDISEDFVSICNEYYNGEIE